MKISGGIAVVAAVLASAAGATATVGTADAASRPSVRTCAVWDNGRPYVGPMALTTRQGFWGPTRTLNSAPSGCMVWKGVRPGKAYRVVVQFSSGCSRPSNSTFAGWQMTTTGSSVWKVAPRQGQVDLGKFVVQTFNAVC